MNPYFTKNPIVGTPLTPSVIKQINTAVRRYMPIAGNGIRTTITAGGTIISAIPAPASKKQKDKPLPFEVRWSPTQNDGEGAWVIWLPSTPTPDTGGQQRIILIGDQYYQINSLNSASGLPSGWYILRNSASGGDVWFNVTYPYRIGASSIIAGDIQTERAFRPEDQVDGYYKISVHIASMATDDTTGAKKVYQFVDSQINLAQLPMAPGGDGGEGSGVVYPTPFELSRSESSGGVISLSIINRTFFWDGKLIPNQNVPDAPGFSIPATGSVYLRCIGTKQPSSSDADENGFVWTFSIGAAPANEGDKSFNYILYTFTNGEVELDYRDTFLALYSGAKTVEPDDVSMEFIPDAPSGSTPTGDEGKLQIKGFKAGQPADTNTIAEYLMGTAQITDQIWLIVRGKSTGGDPVLGYLPLDALNLYEYAKKTDLSTVNNGTLTIEQGTTTLGTFTANQATGTTVTIPEPPTPPTVNNGILTLNLGSLSKTFSANQATNETITVPAKTIVAGSNVAISVSGNTLTISATGGGSTSGFTGTRRTLALTRYDISTNQLQAKFFTETWANGLMTASSIDSEWSIIEGGQAVTETV